MLQDFASMTQKSPNSAGGVARAEKLSQEERIGIAKKAAQARWDKNKDIPQAEYMGEISIGDMTFPCSVLSDGTRVLTQSDFMTGMGMYYSGWVAQNQQKNEDAADVPHFLAFKSLEPFIAKNLGDLQSITLKYRTSRGSLAHGIKAEIIPKICDVWIDAEEAGKLGSRQTQVAQKAKVLMRALAHVGIVALVDEATGYQEVRHRHALQAILDKYLRTEFAAWAKRFPDEFYQEMFRLKGWSYNPLSVARPGIVGRYTTDVVYERLAPGIVEELERINPKNDRGNRRTKHHQWLSGDIGHPALAQHLHAVIGFMRASVQWDDFILLLDRAFPRKGHTIPLMLE
jgi:hypothetical protein